MVSSVLLKLEVAFNTFEEFYKHFNLPDKRLRKLIAKFTASSALIITAAALRLSEEEDAMETSFDGRGQ